MSSFRRPKSEAALRLYNLPRRELQALCKQYGIPANKTNVAMADALSACIPADGARPKASAGSSLGVSKTTPMKLKLDKKVGLPETSLASLILTGKRKVSPVKAAEQPTNVEDGGFPKLNTTPLKRGVKRPVQAVQEEKSKVTAVPAFTRALQERFGKAPAVSSPKPPVPTPRKRAAEVAAVVTRRGGDALPPVSFYDLVSTPKKSLVPEVIELNSTGKTAYKMKTRLGCRTEDTTILSSDAAGAGNRVLKGKRVVFADEVEPQKVALPKAEPQAEPETETDTIEISYTEIEFKDAAIHKELFGFQRNTTTNEEPDVMKEELENREDASDRTQETGFEFRDMALHQEIFGAHGKSESECEEVVQSPLDLQQAGTSTRAVELDTLERETCNSPTNYPAEVLHYSNTVPVQDHSVLPSIREDAYEVSDGQGEARQEHTKQHLAQGPDPSPLPNDVSPENLAENPCESSSEAPDHSQPTSLGGPTAEIHNDCEFTLEQEPSLVSSSANVHLVTDEERDLEDTQQHQSENHEVVMLVDGDTKQHQLDNHEVIQDTQQHQSENHEVVMLVDGDTQEHRSENHEGIMLVDGDTKQHQLDNHEVIQDTQQHQSENHEVVVLVDGNTQQHQSENHDVVTFAEGSGDEPLDKQCSEETFVSSVPVPDEAEKAQSSSSLEFDEVQFSLGLDEKENTENSLIVATAKRVVADGSELVMSDSSSPSIPLTPATNAQDNSTKRLSGPGSSNIPVTPAVNVQVYSAKRLSGPGSFNIPATPVAKGQDSSNKRLSGPGSFSIPVTPLANAQDNSAKRLSGLRSSNISMTPPTNAQQNTTKYLSVPTSSDIPVTPVTKLKGNSDSALANAATPLTKIQSNIDSTLAKATSILEKLAAWRADAEKKMREGYWEPKFSTVVEGASAGPEVERPLAKTVPAVDRDVPSAKKARPMPKSIVDRDVPSAKKARPIPKSIVGPEKPLTVCEDTDIVSKGDMPSAKKLRISDDLSEVSDKENQSDKSIDSDKSQRRMGGIGKEKKKGKKFEVLKDRSKNLPDHGNGLATIKERTGLVRPGDMSLRKLRAQVKQKVSQLETSKASPLRPQKAWNMSH